MAVLAKVLGRVSAAELDHGGQPKGRGQLAQARSAFGGADVVRDLLDRTDNRLQFLGKQLNAVLIEPCAQLAVFPATVERVL